MATTDTIAHIATQVGDVLADADKAATLANDLEDVTVDPEDAPLSTGEYKEHLRELDKRLSYMQSHARAARATIAGELAA